MAIGYNTPISFGREGSAASLNCLNIDCSDSGDYSWTTGPLAEIDIRLPPAREDVVLAIDTGAYVREGNPPQQVSVYLGGAFVGFWRVTAYGTLTAHIPRQLLTGRMTRLALVIPNAVSPFALGLGEDRRELGLHLHSITFRLGQ